MSEWYRRFKNFDEYKKSLDGKFDEIVEKETWHSATTIDKIQAYLDRYPNGRYADEARKKLEDLFWKETKEKDTIDSYQAYLDVYPDGRYASKAKKGKIINYLLKLFFLIIFSTMYLFVAYFFYEVFLYFVYKGTGYFIALFFTSAFFSIAVLILDRIIKKIKKLTYNKII